eukprot:5319877-Pyramimonas_sp.AAC.2
MHHYNLNTFRKSTWLDTKLVCPLHLVVCARPSKRDSAPNLLVSDSVFDAEMREWLDQKSSYDLEYLTGQH